jgi:O-acetyl-ADP-ribose deacetylase (regulator of RNase III)
MPLKEHKGNIFDSPVQAIVNTVNCVGVMGKGVALEFRRRFPEMYSAYAQVCERRLLQPGQILPYLNGTPWILNFAVKNDWKHPSRLEWVESCLQRFVGKYQELGIRSVAMPWLGAMNGGLPWPQVHQLMRSYLSPLDDIAVEIIEFDPSASDPIFRRVEAAVDTTSEESFAELVGITGRACESVWQAVRHRNVVSLAQLIELPGLGKTSIERLYEAFRSEQPGPRPATQQTLFD